MFIRIQDLELRKIEFDDEFQPGDVEFTAEMRQIGPLKATGRAELVREHHGGREIVNDIRIVGDLSGKFETDCARCLEPVQHSVQRSYDLLYRPMARGEKHDEVSISEAETEIGYYSGDGMELTDALREQVLLGFPVKAVCKAECKGICPQCGKNLNEGSCGCKQEIHDPRWDALKELKDKL